MLNKHTAYHCFVISKSRVEMVISSAQHRLFVTAHADRSEAVILHGPVRISAYLMLASETNTSSRITGRGWQVPHLRERDARRDGGRQVSLLLLQPKKIMYYVSNLQNWPNLVNLKYRVTTLLGNSLPLTYIWDVPPSCLGSR